MSGEASRPRSHRIQNRTIGAVLLAEFILLLGHPLFGWFTKHYAATPAPLTFVPPMPPSGDQVLRELSIKAADITGGSLTSGLPYSYVKRVSWSLADSKGSSSSLALRPTTTATWLSPDRDGRIVVHRPRRGVRTAVAPPRDLPDLQGPTPSGVMAFGTNAGDFPRLVTIADAEPIPSSAEAQILLRLARIPRVVNLGSVTDRDGRPGLAVSVPWSSSGANVRFILIFRRTTGALLEADEELLQGSGRLHARAGAVISYTIFLDSKRTRHAG